MTLATWLNKRSLNNNNLASMHGQKCLCDCCGIPHHTSGDLGGALPSYVSGNRHTETSILDVDSAVTLCGFSPSSHSLEAPGRQHLSHSQIRESLQKSRFLVEKFQHSVEAKKYELNILERVRETV